MDYSSALDIVSSASSHLRASNCGPGEGAHDLTVTRRFAGPQSMLYGVALSRAAHSQAAAGRAGRAAELNQEAAEVVRANMDLYVRRSGPCSTTGPDVTLPRAA